MSTYHICVRKVIAAHILSLRRNIFSYVFQNVMINNLSWGKNKSKRYRNLVSNDITGDASVVICLPVFHWSIIQVKDILKIKTQAERNLSLDTEMVYESLELQRN